VRVPAVNMRVTLPDLPVRIPGFVRILLGAGSRPACTKAPAPKTTQPEARRSGTRSRRESPPKLVGDEVPLPVGCVRWSGRRAEAGPITIADAHADLHARQWTSRA